MILLRNILIGWTMFYEHPDLGDNVLERHKKYITSVNIYRESCGKASFYYK